MKHLIAACFVLALSAAIAQPVSVESVRLADVLVANNWNSVEQVLPLLIARVETNLMDGGMTQDASKVFGEELHRSMNRDNFSRALAAVITAKFAPDEIRDVSAFLRSQAGKKYLSPDKEAASNPAYVIPIVKQACDSAMHRLESQADRAIMGRTCQQMQ